MAPKGGSLYLGAFKQFGDIDLLLANHWVQEDWHKLIAIMVKSGFALHDEHEHEFINTNNTRVAFASTDILVRDGITKSLVDIQEVFNVDDLSIHTLKPELFKRAYEFSERGCYRKNVRGKKNKDVITRIDEYLERDSEPTR